MTADITPENVAKMLDGVTDGPWKTRRSYLSPDTEIEIVPAKIGGKSKPPFGQWAELATVDKDYGKFGCGKANARFIAWAREAVPALAAERDALAAALEAIKAQARSDAISEFCANASIGPLVQVKGLPEDVKRFRMETAVDARRAALEAIRAEAYARGREDTLALQEANRAIDAKGKK